MLLDICLTCSTLELISQTRHLACEKTNSECKGSRTLALSVAVATSEKIAVAK